MKGFIITVGAGIGMAIGLILAAILGSCSSNSHVTDFKHVAVIRLEPDGTITPLECDALATGRIIENYRDSTLVGVINGERKEFQIIGNYPEQDGVMVMKDRELNEYLFFKDSLSTGEPVMFIQGGVVVFAFCDVPHPCHGTNE